MKALAHAADPDPDGNVVIAKCGAVGYIMPDASLSPIDFDWAFPDSPCINCLACLRALESGASIPSKVSCGEEN